MAKDFDGNIIDRVETLYASDEYKAFFVTGQLGATGRKAYVDVLPYHTFNADELANATARSEKLTSGARLSITSSSTTLFIRDGFTGTSSSFPVDKLEQSVQERLTGSLRAKFTQPVPPAPAVAQPAAPAPVKRRWLW